jgi:ribosomal protein L11 methyltransferase
MEALEDYLAPGMSVLDVGTGSGILAVAAGLLGAGKIYACDIDAVAVEIAGGLDGPPHRFVGSVDAVASGSADVVLANISPEAIVRLAPDLLRVRRAGGVLLASGLERSEVARVQEKMPEAREVRYKNDWALMAI